MNVVRTMKIKRQDDVTGAIAQHADQTTRFTRTTSLRA
jgi:hypothetical protein